MTPTVHRALAGARRRREDRRALAVLSDPLTGVVSGVLLRDRLVHALQRPAAAGEVAVVSLRVLVPALPVPVQRGTDPVLRTVGQRLLAAAPTGATVARTEGREFVVLLEFGGLPAAVAVAAAMRAVLTDPVVVRGASVQVGVEVGVSAGCRGAVTAHELLRRAAHART